MGRRVDPPAVMTDERREGWTALPPNVPPPDTPLAFALARARALRGAARRDAIEAAGREHVGDDAVDRVLRNGPGGDPDGAWTLTQANLERAHGRPFSHPRNERTR